MEKYDEAIATHKAKVEHYKREMERIKLHPVDDNPTPELKQLNEEELAEMRIETISNKLSQSEAELAKRAITAGASEDAENLAFTNLNNYAEEIRLKISTALKRVNQI